MLEKQLDDQRERKDKAYNKAQSTDSCLRNVTIKYSKKLADLKEFEDQLDRETEGMRIKLKENHEGTDSNQDTIAEKLRELNQIRKEINRIESIIDAAEYRKKKTASDYSTELRKYLLIEDRLECHKTNKEPRVIRFS